ncbi:50S ribosomal protein L11 methyltransferase [uncultured Sphingomonas sp.]|uniref:50S ribosomal protein L11 methyltransferase n=1 Tax=uncultured Sphingomonas sp. TaxID=158754 RepID=UPI0035CA3340
MTAYRLTLPCTRAEAEGIALAEIDGVVLVTTEEEEHADDGAGRWRLDAYFDGEPDADTLAAARALVAHPDDAAATSLADEDWVTLSQAGLEPIREGRFVVYTSAHAGAVGGGDDVVRFRIEAGQAFGTGHHETTSGCLGVLDGLAREGRRYRKIIDLGTGTGLLAFAAVALWADADVTATDIDPIAIEVTRENAAANDVAVGGDIGEVSLLVADGTRDPTIAERAPYDLIIANILAGPLIAMAPEIAAIAAPGATVLLAGLLTTQAAAVETAYAAAGCAIHERLVRGDWTILRLTAGAAIDGQSKGPRTP